MLPDRVSNPGPLTYESGALPIALRGPAPMTQAMKLTERKSNLLIRNIKTSINKKAITNICCIVKTETKTLPIFSRASIYLEYTHLLLIHLDCVMATKELHKAH